MKCPICTVDLVMTDRQGVEIDYCPKCRGVWLDRGEIDKLIERSAALEARAAQPAPPPSAPYQAAPYQASPHQAAPHQAGQPAGFAAPGRVPESVYAPPPQAGWAPPPAGRWRRDEDDDDDRHRGDRHGRKRKGFLSDLLDFD